MTIKSVLFLVSLMTVLELEFKLSMWPTPSIFPAVDVAVLRVTDRAAELALMDNNPSTCLPAFDHGSLFLSLVAYIHVPSCMPDVHVMLDIAGLTCAGNGMIVYHQLSTVEHHDIQFQECTPIMTRAESSGDPVPCKFLCQNVWSEAAMTKVGIRIEKMSWKMIEPVKVCGLYVAN